MTKSARRPELVGLVAASLVTLVGLWLLWGARAEGLRETDLALASGRVVDVSRLERPDTLLPLLEPVVADPVERRFVAGRIATFAGTPENPGGRRRTLSGVGSLGTITITERDLPARHRLPSLRERFAERRDQLAAVPGETDIPIPLLTSAQLAALRRTVVVRAPSVFRLTLLWSSVLLLLPFYAAHAWLRVRRSTGDPHLLPIVHALCGVGFVMMVSLRDPVRDPMLFVRFAQGVAAGCRRARGGRFVRLRALARRPPGLAAARRRRLPVAAADRVRQRARHERREGEPDGRAAGRGDPRARPAVSRRALRAPVDGAAEPGPSRRCCPSPSAWGWCSSSSSCRRTSGRRWSWPRCSSGSTSWREAGRRRRRWACWRWWSDWRAASSPATRRRWRSGCRCGGRPGTTPCAAAIRSPTRCGPWARAPSAGRASAWATRA